MAVAFVASRAASPSPAVAPSPLAFTALAACGALAVLRIEHLPLAVDAWLVVALTALAEHSLLLRPGAPWGHDAGLHLWGAAAIADVLQSGEGSPLWLHRLGAGVPLLQFYPPLGYLPIVVGKLAGLPLDVAFRLAFVLFAALGALGVRRVVRDCTGDRAAALLSAVAFALAPYRLFDAHARTALGESAALAVSPFLWLAFLRLLRGRSGVAPLATAAAALSLAHLVSAVALAYALAAAAAAYFAGLGWSALAQARTTLPRLLAAAGLGAALAAFFLLPLVVDLGATSVARILPARGRFLAQGAAVADLLGVPARDPAVVPAVAAPQPSTRAALPHMVVPFGVTLATALLLVALQALPAAAGLHRGASGGAAHLRAARLAFLAAAVVGLAMSLEAAAPWTARLPGLRVLQFPWRALGVATVPACVCLGLAAASQPRRAGWTRPLVACGLLVAAVVEGWLHAGTPRWLAPWRELSALAPSGGGHYVPVAIRNPPRRLWGLVVPPATPGLRLRSGLITFREYTNPLVFEMRPRYRQILGVGLVVDAEGRQRRLAGYPYAELIRPGGTHRIVRPRWVGGGRIVLRAPAEGGTLMVREQCFPGWQRRSGSSWVDAGCGPDGFLRAPPGAAGRVVWRFDAWRWPRVLGWCLSAAAALWLLGVELVRRRAGDGLEAEPGPLNPRERPPDRPAPPGGPARGRRREPRAPAAR